jgi:hypothetical protein
LALPDAVFPTFFQNGILAGSRLAGSDGIVRATLGPLRRGEAKRLAVRLAALCQTICGFAADTWKGIPVEAPQFDDRQSELVRNTVTACQTAIAAAITNPSQAIGLARGLEGALTSLLLVQKEVAKGDAGAAAVTANADALTRHALTEVLKLSTQPEEALAALAAVKDFGPQAPAIYNAAAPAVAPAAATSGLPLFSEISQSYIDMRNERDRDSADIPMLILRRQVFLDLIGDRTPDQYYPSDLQTFVNRMQYWPANVTKRSDMEGKSTLEILESNKNFRLQPMAQNTLRGGYIANVRTMMRHRIQDLKYQDPFAGAKISMPKAYKPPKPREGVSLSVTNRVFDAALKDAIDAAENLKMSNDNSFGAGGLHPSATAEDRRGVLVRVSMDVRRKLKLVAINRNTTVQDLLVEAIAAILEEPDPAPRP